ncbi:ribosomal protein P0 (A0) (L10E) [Polyrhizophydium stewartii]|uniref:60S acidic ribosomal protein P0 n=1 Tax=Polyrhizophydium stewartii TaxID=2732419 RepID=A0ABR4NEP6_9FUNG|nr:ribosomal protein P0 (A0) (L10E) [Polyrhizophydium stewartii]
MAGGEGNSKKEIYFTKLNELLQEYSTIFIVNVDNVGSNQMHQIRKALRGKAVVLMGKNTMVRRALRNGLTENPQYEKLLSLVKGNIGFVFTKGDLKEIRDAILANRVQAPAKAGAIAPVNVVVPAGNTGMEPGKTSFFQAIGIATKIARGTIEIINDVEIIQAGNKVGASEAQLLNMLNISPFTYGMTITAIYDNGTVFDTAILDITDEALLKHVATGIANITAISLAIGYPTVASVPHILINGYKNLLSVAVTLENYSFDAIDRIKEILADPSKFAAAAPVAAASDAPAASSSAPAAAAAPAEEEESDEDMGFDLFD